jgi:hypothetical protein
MLKDKRETAFRGDSGCKSDPNGVTKREVTLGYFGALPNRVNLISYQRDRCWICSRCR